MKTATTQIVGLTDALLVAARSPRPDLDLMTRLLTERGELIAQPLGVAPADRAERLAGLLQVQAVDAEIRSLLAERHANVRDQLVLLARRPGARTHPAKRAQYLDRRA